MRPIIGFNKPDLDKMEQLEQPKIACQIFKMGLINDFKMSDLVSIIVPCYNQAQYLDEALLSVLDQTYTHWECIIVNDGSPDNTEEIAKRWVEKDGRFLLINKNNEGVCIARNTAIEKAKGVYILPLDADDFISANYLEKCIEKIENSTVKVVYGKAVFFGEQEGKLPSGYVNVGNLLKHNCIHSSGFFRKSDWKLNNGYDENMKYGFEDWEFWINMLKKDGEALLLEQCILNYRIKSLSRSTEINSNLKKNYEMKAYIFQKHIELYGYTTAYELYNEKLKLENKLKNPQLHYTCSEIIIVLLKKIKSIFLKLK